MLTLFDTLPAAAITEPDAPAPRCARPRGAGAAVHARPIGSPVGPLLAAATDAGVCVLEFAEEEARTARQLSAVCGDPDAVRYGTDHPMLDELERQLGAYFGGFLERFDVALAPVGTAFQMEVWEALGRIPCGQTRSYAQVAAKIGRPSAVRAVANANGANRLAILIPCHRVIGSDGSLTGYGGGLARKDWLLRHEQELTSLFSPAQLASCGH